MKAVAEVIGVSRSNLIERLRDRPKKRLGRPPLPDDDLVADIKVVVAELPTYGYRRSLASCRNGFVPTASLRPAPASLVVLFSASPRLSPCT